MQKSNSIKLVIDKNIWIGSIITMKAGCNRTLGCILKAVCIALDQIIDQLLVEHGILIVLGCKINLKIGLYVVPKIKDC